MFVFRQEGQRLSNTIAQIRRRFNRLAHIPPFHNICGNLLGIRLVRILDEHMLDFLTVELQKPLCATNTRFGIQAQIQRPFHLIGKTARRIIDLHRANPQIRQHEIELFARVLDHFINIGKILQSASENILTIACITQTLFRLDRLNRIDVQAVNMPLALQLFEHRTGVTAIAKRGVQTDLSRLNLQEIENFLHHNRNMHTSRSMSFIENVLHVGGVLFGIQLLIFFFKALGVRTGIAYPALMGNLFFHKKTFLSFFGIHLL